MRSCRVCIINSRSPSIQTVPVLGPNIAYFGPGVPGREPAVLGGGVIIMRAADLSEPDSVENVKRNLQLLV